MADELEKRYLQEWRLGKYWSPSKLAELAGINRSIISKIESGEQVGRLGTAVKIAEALGIRPEQIIDFDKLFEVKSDREAAVN
jgi:transcriptional regulator with XRE-family HTH domain